jgi:hypothetical protein
MKMPRKQRHPTPRKGDAHPRAISRCRDPNDRLIQNTRCFKEANSRWPRCVRRPSGRMARLASIPFQHTPDTTVVGFALPARAGISPPHSLRARGLDSPPAGQFPGRSRSAVVGVRPTLEVHRATNRPVGRRKPHAADRHANMPRGTRDATDPAQLSASAFASRVSRWNTRCAIHPTDLPPR